MTFRRIAAMVGAALLVFVVVCVVRASALDLAFGHDEELGGFAGAAEIGGLLKERAGKLAFLVDEGGVVAEGLMPGVDRPVALIGVVEKDSIGVNLTVERTGGHSSMPPEPTAVGVLSQAIVRLEENQMPARLTPVVKEMLLRVAPEMPLGMRLPLANLWAFRPVIVRALLGNPRTAALLRTTTAATMVSGSPKENVCQLSPGGSLISGSCRETRRKRYSTTSGGLLRTPPFGSRGVAGKHHPWPTTRHPSSRSWRKPSGNFSRRQSRSHF